RLADVVRRRAVVGARRAMRRLGRLRASPHEIALGCAVGAFASSTPLVGMQTALGVVLAFLLRASVPAAVAGSFVGNPLSWPFLWLAAYVTGLHMVGVEAIHDPMLIEHRMHQVWIALLDWSPRLMETATALVWPILWPMLAG